jgi:hypothetical protein
LIGNCFYKAPPRPAEEEYIAPLKGMTATSVMPPPISITIDTIASGTGRLAPIAEAIGFSKHLAHAPVHCADSGIARLSSLLSFYSICVKKSPCSGSSISNTMKRISMKFGIRGESSN